VAEAFGGGLLEVVKTVAEGTAQRGHRVAIAHGVRPETPRRPRDVVSRDVELFPLSWTTRTAPAQLTAGRELRELVDRWRPDVIHLHAAFAGLVGSAACAGRARLVYSPHACASGIDSPARWQRHSFRAAERFVCRRVDLIGAVSRSEAALITGIAGRRRVVVVENGISELNDPGLRPAPAKADPPVAIAAGRIVPQRRPDACARILSSLAGMAEPRWIGGGSGAEGGPGRAALAAARIPVTGWLPRAEMLGELDAATAYLHWTAWDGQPLSILEAMAFDAVVVASDIPANREVVGLRQTCATEQQAAALLRRVVLEPELRASLLRDQRERRGRYAARRMVGEWVATYEMLAERPAARPAPAPPVPAPPAPAPPAPADDPGLLDLEPAPD
jgi:glycosyltransferase involved in cell wall biosynthesis